MDLKLQKSREVKKMGFAKCERYLLKSLLAIHYLYTFKKVNVIIAISVKWKK